jgi:hypothetical protein
MTGIEELKDVFRDKLERTMSLDDAFRKAVWIAYKRGYTDGSTTPEIELQPPKWAREETA